MSGHEDRDAIVVKPTIGEGPAGIPPIVRRLGLVSFFTDAASEMIYPLLPALLRSFGGASVWLGAMEGTAEAVSAAVKWRMGNVTDRAARKKPLVVSGYAIATFARPLLAFTFAAWQVVLLRTLDRIGKGVRGVPRDALIAESTPSASYAASFALHRAMDNAGSVLGPLLAFVLLALVHVPVRWVIGLALFPGLVSLSVLMLGVHEPPPAVLAEREHVRGGPSSPLPKVVRRYLMVLALFTLGSSADSFLLLRMIDLGLPERFTPIVWLALSGAKALSNVPGGRLADRVGREKTLVAAWSFYAVVYASFAWVARAELFVALVLAYGAYYGLAEGPERAILAAHTPVSMRGRAFAAMHAVTGVAVLPANLAFGLLYRRSPPLAFASSAACALCAAALLFLVVVRPSKVESS